MTQRKLGAVQLEIMKVLWSRGEATARELTDALAATGNLAHSTVQTLLRKLEAKGAVSHYETGRVFVFRPVWREEETTQSAASDLLDRVFNGSVSGLVSHLLKNEKVSAEELAELRKLVDEAAAGRTEEDQ